MASSATTARVNHNVDLIGDDSLEIVTVTWIAHTDGSFTDYTIPGIVSGKLVRAVFNPGSPAPTTLYDMTIVDEDAFDVLGGGGANLSATVTSESACPFGTYLQRWLANTLIVTIANNSVNSASGTVALYLKK